jgi:hypothetical protein
MNYTYVIDYSDYGWYVEWYTDSDNGSGLGDNPKVQYWYGTRDECYDRVMEAPCEDAWFDM